MCLIHQENEENKRQITVLQDKKASLEQDVRDSAAMIDDLESRLHEVKITLSDVRSANWMLEDNNCEEQKITNRVILKHDELKASMANLEQRKQATVTHSEHRESTPTPKISSSHKIAVPIEPQPTMSPRISVITYVMTKDGSLKQQSPITVAANDLPTKKTLTRLVMEKYSRMIATEGLGKNPFYAVRVANPFSKSACGWSDVAKEEFIVWLKTAQELQGPTLPRKKQQRGGDAAGVIENDGSAVDGFVTVFLGAEGKGEEVMRAILESNF